MPGLISSGKDGNNSVTISGDGPYPLTAFIQSVTEPFGAPAAAPKTPAPEARVEAGS